MMTKCVCLNVARKGGSRVPLLAGLQLPRRAQAVCCVCSGAFMTCDMLQLVCNAQAWLLFAASFCVMWTEREEGGFPTSLSFNHHLTLFTRHVILSLHQDMLCPGLCTCPRRFGAGGCAM